MFLTITIDTTQTKKPKLRTNKIQALATKGWRERFGGIKKKSLWQRVVAFRRKVGGGIYKLGDQIAMF